MPAVRLNAATQFLIEHVATTEAECLGFLKNLFFCEQSQTMYVSVTV